MSYSEVASSALFSGAKLHDNELSEASLRKEITASHHLVRNNPLLRVGATRFRASCIGDGANPVLDPNSFNSDVITSFKQWSLYCDHDENTNFSGIQALAVITMLLEGNAFIVRRRTTNNIPLQLQVVSPLSLATNLDRPGKSRYVRAGVLYSKKGKTKKFAFYKLPRDHPEFDEESVNWLPASDVIHLKDNIHAGQSLAQPWVSSGASFASQYKDNQAVETKSRLKRTGQQIFALKEDMPAQTSAPGQQNAPPKVVHKVGGITVLNGVKDVKHASPPEMAGNYQEHNNQVLRMIAGILGITYEMLTGDLTQVNYSSIRAGMINHRNFIKQLRKTVLEPAFNRILGWFLEAWQLKNATELPGYFDNPYAYLDPEWIWPEWEEIDPLKAAKALVMEVNNNLQSMEEVQHGRGKTLNSHLDSVQRSHEAMKERGIHNAASVTDDDEQPDDDDDSGS